MKAMQASFLLPPWAIGGEMFALSSSALAGTAKVACIHGKVHVLTVIEDGEQPFELPAQPMDVSGLAAMMSSMGQMSAEDGSEESGANDGDRFSQMMGTSGAKTQRQEDRAADRAKDEADEKVDNVIDRALGKLFGRRYAYRQRVGSA